MQLMTEPYVHFWPGTTACDGHYELALRFANLSSVAPLLTPSNVPLLKLLMQQHRQQQKVLDPFWACSLYTAPGQHEMLRAWQPSPPVHQHHR